MDINTYVPKVRGLINRLDTVEDDHLHMAMGMVGEIGEVVDLVKKRFAYGRDVEDINILEELGDFVFYTVGLADMVDIDLTADDPDPSLEEAGEVELLAALALQATAVLTGAAYRELTGRREVGDVIRSTLKAAEHLARRLGSSLEEVFDINIRKLSVRYPNLTFDTDRANNRDVAAEQEAMRS